MYVKCVNDTDMKHITKDKIYKILNIDGNYYHICNDNNETNMYSKSRFITASGSDIADIIPVNTSKILDSGARRSFDTGAVRDIAEGKGRCDLLPLRTIGEMLDLPILINIDSYIRNGSVASLHFAMQKFVDTHKEWENIYTAFLEVSKQYEDGCKKYGDRNWEKGIPVHCYIDSGVRHYLKYMRGDTDEPHDRAFVWNMLGAIWTHNNMPELIDLPFKDKKE